MITHVEVPAAVLEGLAVTSVTVRPTVSDVLVTSVAAVLSNLDGGRPSEHFAFELDGGGP